MRPVKGFTLFELIFTLAILAILVSLGIPAMVEWQNQAKSRALQYTLLHSAQYSRKQAVHLRTPVTLCPGKEACEDNWGDHILIFTDPNLNARLDEDETLLKVINLGDTGKQLSWNRRRAYLRYASQGISGLAGTLKYCSISNHNQYNFGLVVSPVGRVRITDDVNCS